MEDKPNYWSVIPANIRYDKDLKANEKLLYSEITSLMNKEGYCYASNKYFADLYNVSIQSISTWINNLVDKGYLDSELVYKENSKEIAYRKLTIPVLKKSLIGIQENFNTAIQENFKDNNKYISINNNIEIYINEIQKFKPILNVADYELISQIKDKYSLDEVKRAIEVCKSNGAYSIKYLMQVLTNKQNKVKDIPKWVNDNLKEDKISKDDAIELIGGWNF